MNRAELKRRVVETTDVSAADTDQAVDAVIAIITDTLVAGEKISLAGFGVLETRERAARAGRNPRTGEAIQVAASTAVTFKPAAEFKRKLANSRSS